MIQRGIAPNTTTYSSLIDGFCKENRLDEANQMLDLMVTKGCDPDDILKILKKDAKKIKTHWPNREGEGLR